MHSAGLVPGVRFRLDLVSAALLVNKQPSDLSVSYDDKHTTVIYLHNKPLRRPDNGSWTSKMRTWQPICWSRNRTHIFATCVWVQRITHYQVSLHHGPPASNSQVASQLYEGPQRRGRTQKCVETAAIYFTAGSPRSGCSGINTQVQRQSGNNLHLIISSSRHIDIYY